MHGDDHLATLSIAHYQHIALTGLGDVEAADGIHRRFLQPLLDTEPQTLDFPRRHLRQELIDAAAGDGD